MEVSQKVKKAVIEYVKKAHNKSVDVNIHGLYLMVCF